MPSWRILDYVSARGENEIKTWVASLPPGAQAKFDYILFVLRSWQGLWPSQYGSHLKGFEGIFELRIGYSGVQYRPLGCFGPGDREFTLLLGAIEKGRKLPKSVCEMAVERRKIILQDRSRVRDHEF